MKSATVTWISYNNYGTQLQAYALQQYLKGLGLDNTIISDKAIIPHKLNDISQDNILEIIKNSGVFKSVLHPTEFAHKTVVLGKLLNKHIKEKSYYNSQTSLTNFNQERLDILPIIKREDMRLLNDKFDMFICGSDQIWSVFDINFDGYYYLDFVNKPKISYAASIGTEIIDLHKSEKIKEYLQTFSAVSVREKQTSEFLTELTKQNVEWVCDPTLLHNSHFWSEFCGAVKQESEKYILCYFLEYKDWYFEYAQALESFLGIKLLLIPNRLDFAYRKDTYRKAVGPKEFVSLIKNAEYILTDSYHASIFSIIFERNFTYFKRFKDNAKKCQNIRISSLFNYLDLKNVVEEKKFDKNDVYSLDYSNVNEKLNKFITHSQNFIKHSIGEINEI